MIEQLLTSLFTKLLAFVNTLFNTLFGNWNWAALFSWLPQDILTAAQGFILVCFALCLFRILRSVIPF